MTFTLRAIVALMLSGLSVVVLADDQPPARKADDGFYGRHPATIECVVEAANKQDVPANVLLAFASIESGKNGQLVVNKNGTIDISHFQINSSNWLPGGAFAHYPSITKDDVQWRGCYNAELAAWLLHKHLTEDTDTDFWTRAANYHSRTPEYNAVYRGKLIPLSIRWGKWLQQRVPHALVSYQPQTRSTQQ
jgi:hypothetical protein